MPRRRRFTPLKSKKTPKKEDEESKTAVDQEVSTARGRLKGALMEILEPSAAMDSDSSDSGKRDKRLSSSDSSSDDENKPNIASHRQSYILKLFDRSVDLSQFKDDTPLYPICRAWMINKPKADYRKISILNMDETNKEEDDDVVMDLPDPEGPVVSCIPNLIPEQLSVDKDNINLNYDSPLPTKGELLYTNMKRWNKVRTAWQEQSQLVHQRYDKTQEVLNKLSLNGL